MNSLTIIQKKNESQKNQILLRGLMSLALLCLCLGFPLSSNAGDGVNSNTITSGTTSTSSTGNPTASTVTNEDGSQTTTTTTPITTTTTQTTVTQTGISNVVKNPTFTNELGGGSSTKIGLFGLSNNNLS